jgi:phosphohistidine phosphatase
MKRIILMRHADAEVGLDILDYERNLSELGVRQAQEAADYIGSNIKIDRLLVSSAKRTIQTSEIVVSRSNISEVAILDTLYRSSAESMLDLIRDQDDNIECILLIAHNPSIQMLAIELAKITAQLNDNLVTKSMFPAQIVVLDYEVSKWAEIKPQQGNIYSIFVPYEK